MRKGEQERERERMYKIWRELCWIWRIKKIQKRNGILEVNGKERNMPRINDGGKYNLNK